MKNLLSLVLASMISVVSSAGSIYYVSPDGTDDAACTYDNPGSISAALALAEGGESWEDGDTIIFREGKYSIPTKGQKVTYTINKPFLTLRSENNSPERTIIVGGYTNSPGRGFDITGPVFIGGIAFTNFASCYSGIVLNCKESDEGRATVSNCVFVNNLGYTYSSSKSRYGTAIGGAYYDCSFMNNTNDAYSQGGAGIISGVAVNCKFLHNHSNQGAAIMNTSATNCFFYGNKSTYTGASGGAAYFSTTGKLYRCSFIANSAAGNGGAVCASVNVFAENCDFICNTNSKAGGAIAGVSTLNCRFEGNKGSSSGGIISGGSHTNAVAIGNSGYQGLFSGEYYDCYLGTNTGYYIFTNFKGYRCHIDNNKSDYSTFYTGGPLINCLITTNNMGRDRPFCGFTSINCTYVGNVPNLSYGAMSGGVSTNCIFWGSNKNDLTGGTHNAAYYGKASTKAIVTNQCVVLTEAPFVYDGNPEAPYTPKLKSPVVNSGIPVDSEILLEKDFYGRGRIRNGVIDVGCAERYPRYLPSVMKVR